MGEISPYRKMISLRISRRAYDLLRRKAEWENRSQASIFREALNRYLVSEVERGRINKAFKIIANIFCGDKKHGIMFLDVLSQILKDDEKECKDIAFMAARILRDYGIWITYPSVNRNAIRYEINDARSWSKLLTKYQSIKRRFRKEMDVFGSALS